MRYSLFNPLRKVSMKNEEVKVGMDVQLRSGTVGKVKAILYLVDDTVCYAEDLELPKSKFNIGDKVRVCGTGTTGIIKKVHRDSSRDLYGVEIASGCIRFYYSFRLERTFSVGDKVKVLLVEGHLEGVVEKIEGEKIEGEYLLVNLGSNLLCRANI